jgi:hypothetical protein
MAVSVPLPASFSFDADRGAGPANSAGQLLCPEFVVHSPGMFSFVLAGLIENNPQEEVVGVHDMKFSPMLQAVLSERGNSSSITLEMARTSHTIAVMNTENAYSGSGRSVSIHYSPRVGLFGPCFATVEIAPGAESRYFLVRRGGVDGSPPIHVILASGFYEFIHPDRRIIAKGKRHSSSHATLDVAQGIDASLMLCVYLAVMKMD